jgi:Reverse transcriptase (RNA-dependent DNA polymerase)
MYTLRALTSACTEHHKGMAIAYVDFAKAYDSINRAALWQALKLYGVHAKIIRLLIDLHTDNIARVRLGGKLGSEFKVTAGVRQGCVIAPTLFNVYIDMVVRHALRRMPPDCGIHIRSRWQGEPGSIEHIVLLMYADDIALMAHDVSVLVEMLRVLDNVATQFGMKVNASKTEVQIIQGTQNADLPTITISTGQVKVTDVFKYLGSWTQQDGGMDKEISMRRSAALGVFQSFANVWGNQKLGVSHKMAVYNSCVLPHFLYGCESWACKQAHLHMLETAHNMCLRRIMGAELRDRHSTAHVHEVCGSQPLELTVMKRVFKWLGHVMRMPAERYPRMVFGCVPAEGGRARGRPRYAARHMYSSMLSKAGVQNTDDWLSEMPECAQDRVAWRRMVEAFSFEPKPKQAPQRHSARLEAMQRKGAA